jgi:hypothetical protein
MEFPFKINCPGFTCHNGPLYWPHSCGTNLMITVDGDLRCPRCNYNRFIQDWTFKCDNSTHGSEAVPFTIQAVCSGISFISNDATILTKLTQNIMNKWKF